MNPIHIAGTKGKGSTSSFVSSILCQYVSLANYATDKPKITKVGLYTSPHLRYVRERIQINGTPISEEMFAKYFFEVWDRLEASAKARGEPAEGPGSKPVYFRYLTLMAFHTYMSENVDAAVFECGIGGEYDSTNILVNPVVTGITTLGIDHTGALGSSIEEIAWHKAGIMKKGSKAFTAPQREAAMNVLFQRAKEKEVELQIAKGNPELEQRSLTGKLGLAGEFQYINANLAVAISSAFLNKLGIQGGPRDGIRDHLPDNFKRGLRTVKLGGRCETRIEKNISWNLDGGHTLDSIEAAGKWFSSTAHVYEVQHSRDQNPRVLIFNQQSRDSIQLAKSLHETLSAANVSFSHAIFCTNITFKEEGYRPDLMTLNTDSFAVEKLVVQNNLAKTWNELSPATEVHVFSTIENAVDFVRDLAGNKDTGLSATEKFVSVLVTGSLHLVGGMLEVLETTNPIKLSQT